MKLLKLVPDNTNIGFVRWRFIGVGISVLLILLSLFAVVTKGFNFGVDFAGGVMMEVQFDETPDVNDLRQRVDALGLGAPNMQEFGDSEVAIRMPLPAEGSPEAVQAQVTAILGAINEVYPGAELRKQEVVSGKVSNELIRDGTLASVLAMVAVAAYIWLRFEWQFGVGALFALIHDVAVALGVFAWFQIEFDLNIIAALLTIIGYSLNDTIVNYDRIRENLRKYRKMEMAPLLDLSINEVLARTVMTSLTMVIALVVLIIWGGPVLFGFTLAMLIGIIVGTYSSVYVAGPLLIWLGVGPSSFLPPEDSNAERVSARS